ncbi:MAG TPA: hypothetical protein VNK52_04120 [Hyphomicrobiaceae bacterium]|nr:hypothetical protein [Hyphomicrobiaceae bacterium]
MFAARSASALARLLPFASLALAFTAAAAEVDAALMERMAKEKAGRHACKVAICDVARNRRAEGPDIACSIVKTWTVGDLKEGVLKGRLDWPWGHAQCQADIRLDRKTLAQVLTADRIEVKLAKHRVACTLDQKEGAGKYTISFAIMPTVTFAGGKAIRATLNWSEIEGSALAKGAVWSAATLDNHIGVFETATLETINAFFSDRCDEVKDELGR